MQSPRRLASRRLVAQALMAAAAAAAFLPWETGQSANGMDRGEGSLVFIVAVVAIGLVQIGWRPAWMAAGLVVAVAGRELLSIVGDDSEGVGAGLWITVGAALAATVLLCVDMFSTIERAPPDPGEDA